tara:strand:+ start:202 stop:432 length:231 start_codon:yes stop_codon:yes gene_type:complete
MNSTTVAVGNLHNHFLTWKDVIAITGKSESTIQRAIKRKDFPAPVKLFGKQSRAVGFRSADFYLWSEGRWIPEGGE